MTGRQSLIIRALTLSEPGDLFDGRDKMTRRVHVLTGDSPYPEELVGEKWVSLRGRFMNGDVIVFSEVNSCISSVSANG